MNCPGNCYISRGSVYYHVTKLLNTWSGGKPCGRGHERVSEAVCMFILLKPRLGTA